MVGGDKLLVGDVLPVKDLHQLFRFSQGSLKLAHVRCSANVWQNQPPGIPKEGGIAEQIAKQYFGLVIWSLKNNPK